MQCIAAGSHIANQEQETVELQPLAIQLCKCMTKVREALREQYILHRSNTNTQKVSCIADPLVAIVSIPKLAYSIHFSILAGLEIVYPGRWFYFLYFPLQFKDLLEQFDHLWCDFEFRSVTL